MNRLTMRSSLLLITVLGLLLSGCAGSVMNMSVVPPEQANFAPAPGKAMVVFMRPSSFGFAIQSAVFEIVADEPQLIGIVSAKKKVAHQVDPGERLFMVTGESGDFMGATLDAGKIYYATITPRMGAWKARFSLAPITSAEQESGQYQQWLDGCQWVVVNADSETWFRDNLTSIKKKQNGYFPKWQARSTKPRLKPEDGVTP